MSGEAGGTQERPDLTEILGQLFSLAGRAPLEGLRYWRDVIVPQLTVEPGSDDFVARTFERLATLAHGAARADERNAVEAEIAAARARLVGPDDSRSAHLQVLARGFSEGLRRVFEDEAVEARTPSLRELQDLLLLEDRLDQAGPQECLAWLEQGLLAGRERPALAHIAFPPIRLYPGDRVIDQLAGALLEGQSAGLKVPDRIREAAVTALALDRPLPEPDLALDRDLWRLLAGFAPQVRQVADARRYLARLASLAPAQDTAAPVVTAICEAVDAIRPGSAAQSAFFERLKRDAQFWRPEFAVFGMRALRREQAAYLAQREPAETGGGVLRRQVGAYGAEIEAALGTVNGPGGLSERIAAELDDGEGRDWRGVHAAWAARPREAFMQPPPARALTEFAHLAELMEA